jgi:3-methylcrotonyl-CoA carboxylase alpha subunit
VDYRGAGTVEFLLEPDGHFWFMEMNTRLQVEHPVTECITGLDLVEWQLRVAAGEPLPLAQADIRRDGYAVEARIYAENPEAGFLPSTGRIEAVTWPAGGDVRVDTGVEAGDAISVHYDPMIAKLVVHAPTPAALFARLEAALAETAVFGPHTNLRFLQRLAARLRARSGLCETTWVDREAADLAAPPAPGALALLQAGVAEWRRQDARAADRAARSSDLNSPWAAPDGWRVGRHAPREARLALGDERWRLEARVTGARFEVGGDATGEAARAPEPGGRVTATTADGERGTARCHRHGARLVVAPPGDRFAFEVVDPLAGARNAADTEHDVLAPMPGKVIELKVVEGDAVTAGQPLVLLEAMKMELTVRAPRDAVVGALPHREGEFVEADTVLVHFEEEDA